MGRVASDPVDEYIALYKEWRAAGSPRNGDSGVMLGRVVRGWTALSVEQKKAANIKLMGGK